MPYEKSVKKSVKRLREGERKKRVASFTLTHCSFRCPCFWKRRRRLLSRGASRGEQRAATAARLVAPLSYSQTPMTAFGTLVPLFLPPHPCTLNEKHVTRHREDREKRERERELWNSMHEKPLTSRSSLSACKTIHSLLFSCLKMVYGLCVCMCTPAKVVLFNSFTREQTSDVIPPMFSLCATTTTTTTTT